MEDVYMSQRPLGGRRRTKQSAISNDIMLFLIACSDYLLVFLLVVLSGSIWSRIGYIESHTNLFRAIVLGIAVVSALLRFIKSKGRLNIAPLVLTAGLLVFAFALSYIGADSKFTSAAFVYFPLICFAFLAGSLSGEDDYLGFVARFANVVVIFATVSLFFFFLGSTLHILRPSGTVMFEWDWVRTASSYNGLYYEIQKIDILGLSGYRNCGIFAEAPMYVLVLVAALCFQSLFCKKSYLKEGVLVAALVTTFSTTAYITIVILYLGKYIFKRENNRLHGLKVIVVPIVLLIGLSVVYIFVADKSSTGSYGVRSDHFMVCWQVFLNSLPFGCGLGNTSAISRYLAYDQGLSVGLPYLFAETGLVGIVLIAAPIIYAITVPTNTNSAKVNTCVLVYLWIFMVTNVMFNSMVEWLFLMIVFFGLPSAERREKLGSPPPRKQAIALPVFCGVTLGCECYE